MRGILGFLFVIGAGILIHEIGHYLAAGWFKILRHEFSIGIGPAIWRKRRGETLYTLRAIPLGGSLAMASSGADIIKKGQQIGIHLTPTGMIERICLNPVIEEGMIIGKVKEFDLHHQLALTIEVGNQTRKFSVYHKAMYEDMKTKETQFVSPYDRCFESKSILSRLIVLVSGAFMNFLFAFILVLIVGLVQGKPYATNEIIKVEMGTPAQIAGIKAGDQIIKYNEDSITNGQELKVAIRESSDLARVTFIRDGEVHEVYLEPVVIESEEGTIPSIGVVTDYNYDFSLGYALEFAVLQVRTGISLIFKTFEMLLVTHEAGIGDLSGPVGVAMMSIQVANQGILHLLVFSSIINLNLGIMNLLPIPALDGGRIIFILIEILRGRPISPKVEQWVHSIGYFVLMGLFVFIFLNDIQRLI